MCYKAGHKQVLCFQRGPLQKLQCAGILLSKELPNAPEESIVCTVSTLLSKGPLTATVMCKYLDFKAATAVTVM